MTFLAAKLKHRVQILVAVRTANAAGGYDKGYRRVGSVWAGVEANERFHSSFNQYIRAQQVDVDVPTHIFMMRHGGLHEISPHAFGLEFGDGPESHPGGLGRQYGISFGLGFDSIPDLNSVKASWYLMMEDGVSYRGRLFRVLGQQIPTENDEYVRIRASEEEEWGTGVSD